MQSFKAKRALANHSRNLKTWNRINTTISKRRIMKKHNPMNSTLLFKSDNYRKKKELLDKIELTKTPFEREGDFAWILSLRTHKQELFKDDNSVIGSYSNNLASKGTLSNKTMVNFCSRRSSNGLSKAESIANRTYDSLETEAIKDMRSSAQFYFLEPTSKKLNELWVRKKIETQKPSDLEVVRKSYHDMSQTLDLTDSPRFKNQHLPRKLVDTYKHKLTLMHPEKVKKPKKSQMRSSIKSSVESSTSDLPLSLSHENLVGVNDDEQLMGVEVVGKNKMDSEIEACYNMQGTRYWVKNHHLTETGEDEPYLQEETIMESYS